MIDSNTSLPSILTPEHFFAVSAIFLDISDLTCTLSSAEVIMIIKCQVLVSSLLLNISKATHFPACTQSNGSTNKKQSKGFCGGESDLHLLFGQVLIQSRGRATCITTFVTRETICSAVKLNVLLGVVVKLGLGWRRMKLVFGPHAA